MTPSQWCHKIFHQTFADLQQTSWSTCWSKFRNSDLSHWQAVNDRAVDCLLVQCCVLHAMYSNVLNNIVKLFHHMNKFMTSRPWDLHKGSSSSNISKELRQVSQYRKVLLAWPGALRYKPGWSRPHDLKDSGILASKDLKPCVPSAMSLNLQ